MGVVMKQFIDRFAAMEKMANETLAKDPEALVGVDSLPGSEHDAKVPEEAKKPDAEVAQGQPAGAASTEGAVAGGDAKPLNEGKLEVDQPLLNAEQKPLITDDALTAKEANAHLVGIVKDLLADINAEHQKQASATAAQTAKPDQTAKPAETKQAEEKKEPEKTEPEKKDDPEKKAEKQTIRLDDETISKLAAASATFMAGRKAAEEAVKQASVKQASAKPTKDAVASARALIKAACIKSAQESGLNPEEAEAAAENAMAAAGVAGEDAGAAEAAAAEAAAAGAGEGAPAEAAIPDDVTEEELATAIVDLVQSGELDVDTAKALVEDIAGDQGGAAPTEDQAAEIIAQGLQSGEITPEQAQQIAAAVEAENAGAGDASEGAVDAEAQGAADAAAAAQEAADEAQGAADAEAAMKAAAAQIRQNAIKKVASAVVTKRQEKQAAAMAPAAKGSKIMAKVASILQAKKDEIAKADTQKKAEAEDTNQKKYMEGFRKQAEKMGIDPVALAKYALAQHQAKK